MPTADSRWRETAENLAEQYRVGREAVDCYAALQPELRRSDAWARGASPTRSCR